ncbi:MAG: heme exporter protein CcmB [Chromatiales bacterium]|nr:heme exporter protein CcmB [Chromatiales bacterium]
MSGAIGAGLAVIRRDLMLALRVRREIANPLLFFVIVLTLFPLGVGPDSKLLAALAPGLVWVTALLATLLSLDAMFRADFDDGALDLMLMSPHPLPVLVLAKALSHWLIAGAPMIVLAPLFAVLLGLPGEAIGALVLSLALGTPVLSLIGGIGAALTVALRRGGVILSLLVLPLYVPVLIFGAGVVAAAAGGFAYDASLWFLGGLLILALTLAPFGIAAALRISVN